MSESAGNGAAPQAEALSGAGTAPRAQAEVTARFALHAGSGEDAADGAAELIHRLQEMTSLRSCACDLDVSVEWPRHSS